MRTHALVLAVLALAAAAGATAQETRETPQRPPASIEVPAPGVTQELRLRDGSRIYGRVEAVDGDRIVFRMIAGAEIAVARADVISLANAEGRIVDGEFWPRDDNTTRLFFAPTGRSLPRGRGYVGVFEIMMPFVQVGLTDRVSFGAGTPLIFGMEGGRPFWVTPKVQVVDTRGAQVAAGLLHFANPGGDGDVGIAYGVATLGDGDAAATFGVGYAYSREGDDHRDRDEGGRAMVAMVGGERRVSRRLKLITENYVWEGGGGLLSGGLRFLGERLSADLALVVPLNAQDFVAFPVVNFVWMF